MTRAAMRPRGRLEEMPGAQSTDVVRNTQSDALVYLVHGVTGTPAEMRFLAAALAQQHFDVFVTTLPGHCGRVRDLVRETEAHWREHVHHQLKFAQSRYSRVFAAGLSAGGSLVLDAAADLRLDGIGVLSPTFFYDGWNTPWTIALLPLAMRCVPYGLQHCLFHVDGPPYGIKDPALQRQVRSAYSWKAVLASWVDGWWPRSGGRDLDPRIVALSTAKGYPIFPLKCFTEIDRLTRRVLSRLSAVTAPALILQAREDDITSVNNADLLQARLGSPIKELVLLDDCYHVITVDKQRKAVARHLQRFFLHQYSAESTLPSAA